MPPVDSIFFWLLSGEGQFDRSPTPPLTLLESGLGKRQVLKMIKFWRECLLSHEIIVTAGRTLEYNPHFGVG